MYYVNSLSVMFTIKMALNLSHTWQTRQSSSQRSLNDKGHIFLDFSQSTILVIFIQQARKSQNFSKAFKNAIGPDKIPVVVFKNIKP